MIHLEKSEIHRRQNLLDTLKTAIEGNLTAIYEALEVDLGKSSEEAYLTEISFVLHEIALAKKKLARWASPVSVAGSPALPFSQSYIWSEPYGRVLIIAPWNYPFHLSLAPIVGALAAGNSVTLKPSPAAPATAAVLEKMASEAFRKEQVCVIQGGAEVLDSLFATPFDFIFYTGGPRFGQEVMQRAAASLTPVCLELGGKSPCVVGPGTNMKIAARRIAFGKFLNAGQTCVAPDYILVQEDLKEALVEALGAAIRRSFGKNPEKSRQYSRMISVKATERMESLLREAGGYIAWGGNYTLEDRYFSPTVVVGPRPDSRLLTEEIFGPILPVITYKTLVEAVAYIKARPKPLALYYFGTRPDARAVLAQTSSGGACVNDTIMHLANPNLPFGGVGQSGMGAYHGEAGFRLFSHRRSVVDTHRHLDLKIKYPPYRWFSLLKRFV